MNPHAINAGPVTPIPTDDPKRNMTIATAEGSTRPHIGLVGDTYTILLSGDETDGRYCLIDMHIPPGGGPPPHRHDFEESFTILDGEIEFTFRGQNRTAAPGTTVHIPANAPHSFTNATELPARLLCICASAGQEEFFQKVGVPVIERTTKSSKPDASEAAAMKALVGKLLPEFRTEMV